MLIPEGSDNFFAKQRTLLQTLPPNLLNEK